MLPAPLFLFPCSLASCLYTVYVYVRRTGFVFALVLFLVFPLHAADRPVIVCFGDSITAGYGLSYAQAYPAILQHDLDQAGYRYQVINNGTSGATSKDAVANLPEILRQHPAVVIVEFGGNDGLRGLPLSQTRANLDRVITTLQNDHAKVLLAGITLPPDYGPDYIRQFEQMYRALAAQRHTAFVPMLYKDLLKVPGTIQGDGIHPTARGSQIIAHTLMPALRPLLKK